MDKKVKSSSELLKNIPNKLFTGYYNPKKLLSTNSAYLISIGGRNIGKTTAFELCIFWLWQYHNRPSVLLRRMDSSFRGEKFKHIFDRAFEMIKNVKNYIGITYRSGVYRGYWIIDGKKEYDKPFLYTYSLNSSNESQKGIYDIQNLGLILFDEFLTRESYLVDEWDIFYNAISTVLRMNYQANIIMCANTVSWESPYFREMHLTDIRELKQGDMREIRISDTDTTVTVEYCADNVVSDSRKNIVDNRFFGFASRTAKMIKSGSWEIGNYPHYTSEMREKTVESVVMADGIYVESDSDIVEIEIINYKGLGVYCMVHPTNGIRKDYNVLYSANRQRNDYRIHITPRSYNAVDKLIWTMYENGLFLYADNACGECVRNYWNDVRNNRR